MQATSGTARAPSDPSAPGHAGQCQSGHAHAEGLSGLAQSHSRASFVGGEPPEHHPAARRVDRATGGPGGPEQKGPADQSGGDGGRNEEESGESQTQRHDPAFPVAISGGPPGDQGQEQADGRGGHKPTSGGQGQVPEAAQFGNEHGNAVKEHATRRLGGPAGAQDDPAPPGYG